MNSKGTFLVVVALAFLSSLLTSCNNGQATTSSCSYAAEITAGNSTKKIPTGNCAGSFLSTGAAVHIRVGQSLTVHFIDSAGGKSHGMASARSQNSKVLELTAEKSMEQRYQGVAPGLAEILFSPPINVPELCLSGYGGTIATPCVVAKVTVTQSCASKSHGNCKSPKNPGTTVSQGNPPSSPSAAAPKAEQSPLAVLCKPGFFTKAQAQQIVQQFGFIECFRFIGENKWVVIGNGVSQQASSGPTMGGPIVAMEKCASSNSACLDPSTVHDFANFTVYYPPGSPTDFLGILDATSYGNLLSIVSASVGTSSCPAATFDMANDKWYPNSANQQALETNPESVQGLKTLAPASGAKALAQEAPRSNLSSTSAC